MAGAQAEVMRAAGRLSGRGPMAGARRGSALSAARDYYGQTCVLAKLWQSEKGGWQWEVRGPELGYRTSNEDRPGRKGSSGLWAPGRIGCGGAGCRTSTRRRKWKSRRSLCTVSGAEWAEMGTRDVSSREPCLGWYRPCRMPNRQKEDNF